MFPFGITVAKVLKFILKHKYFAKKVKFKGIKICFKLKIVKN